MVSTIDPILRSIGFYHRDQTVARLYYYTTHPMSYYGDGRVSIDFVGIARNRRDADEPGVLHVYFKQLRVELYGRCHLPAELIDSDSRIMRGNFTQHKITDG